MTAAFDPVELLNSLPPLPGWNERTDLAADTRAAAILERVVSGNVVPFRRPRRRLKIVTGVVITFAVGSAAAAAIWQRVADDERTLSCWSDPLVPPTVQVAVRWDGVADPVLLCEDAWARGEIGFEMPDALRACVTGDGRVAVIPGADDVCAATGFARFEPAADDGGVDADDEIDALERQLGARFNETCTAMQDAADGVREALDGIGHDGWDVKTDSTTSAAEQCASITFDRETNTVFIRSRNPAD